MAAILQIRRGTGSVSLADGELYLNKETQSLQIGSNEGIISLAKLNSVNSGSFNVSGDITLGGTITIGDSTTDNIVINADLNSDIIPNIHKQYNLGNDSKWYKSIYVETVSASFISASFIEGVGNITEFSASVDSRLDQLQNATSSLQLFSASQEAKDSTLAQYTGSVDNKFVEVQASTSSLNSFTASASGRLNNLELTSASHNSRLNNLETYSSSLRDAITVSGVGVASTTTVRGNLAVQGTTTTVNSTTIQLGDNILELNGNGLVNAGLLVKDPTSPNTTSGSLLWDATNDYWIGGALGAESKFLRAGGDNVISSSAQLVEINAFTASANNKFTAIQASTASLNAFTESTNTRLAFIGTTTSSLNSYTSSNDNKFIAVGASTSSLNAFTSSTNNKFTAVQASTASLNVFTASVTASVIELFFTASNHENRIDSLEAGGVGSINILNQYTASAENKFAAIQASTSSLNAFTSSATASIIELFSTASNHETRIDSLELAAFGGLDLTIYATTGSNTFSGSQIISGSVTATGFSGSIAATNGVISGSSQVNGASITGNTITIGSTAIALGGTATIFDGVVNINTTTLTSSADILVNGATVGIGTFGRNNTILGKNALRFTAGSPGAYYNTAVGENALEDCTSDENVAMGYTAATNVTTGFANTAIGFRSLRSNTTGSNNTALGHDSLQNNNGSNNTVVGYNNTADLFTAESNTIIGSQISGLSSNLSNNIILADGQGNIKYRWDSIQNNIYGNLYVSGIVSGSGFSGSIAATNGVVSGSSQVIGIIDSLNSKTGSYATTGSNTFYANQIISGTLTVTQDFIVLGSSSIQNISSSTLDIGTNLIRVNVNQPSIRFGGLAVVDSGSAGSSGSFLYDALQDEFIFVHRGDGTNVTSSHFILGPETYNNLGNETYLTLNKLPKGTGKEHLVDSNITDDGTTITLATNTSVTGRVTATGFSGSLAATNGVVSGSSQLTSSYDTRYALSGSSANINTGSFAITGSNTFRANQIISASVLLSGSLAVGNITPSTTAGRIDAANDIVAFSTSDRRFKENITPIQNALIKIKQIGGYEFDWKEENKIEHGYEGHDMGVIAQEIEAIAPELVKTRESGYKAVKYDKLVSVLIEAIKELSARIDKLENK